ncbi:SDR family NAD(P)-dependent oxidoreductase [Niabella hibiscisoli]|nr:SDR family NAD(P)-dependent oxidoreductase [Niabella hibiscisoli]MCH5719726.1 SDR family NAD(P)-dependent oxidoreductase [Niabella hibiscisoli]
MTETTTGKVWLITGASRGFGRVWTEAALERGDRVAATARSVDSITDLNEKYGNRVLTLALDVTNAEKVKKSCNRRMLILASWI